MTPQPGRDKQLHVLFLSDRLAFPNGMAASHRVRLLARALAERDVRVRVLTLHVTERPPVVENHAVRGEVYGIEFEYACGTTLRSEHFLVRRLVELRGWIVGAVRVLQLRKAHRLHCAYLYYTVQRWSPSRSLTLIFLRALRVPTVQELNERPWSMKGSPTTVERLQSVLWGVGGVVAISGLLGQWAREEARRRGTDTRVLEVPILVDTEEVSADGGGGGGRVFVYAASPAYGAATRFVLEAMQHVWEEFPDCRLVLTGTHPSDPSSAWLLADSQSLDARVQLVGHLPRGELLRLYREATALLIPLFADVRSEARFPTKIGEYLASGRPIVSSRVGEVGRFFTEGVDAFLADAGDVRDYAAKMCETLVDDTRATAIGAAGRSLAAQKFDYRVHGEALERFLREVADAPLGDGE